MEADEKQCPMCAETVKAAAKVCKHCRYEFPELATMAPPPAQSPPGVRVTRKLPWLAKLALVAAGLFVIAMFRIAHQASQDQVANAPDAPSQSADVSVTAEEIAADYQANEVAAQQKYGSKKLGISGEIARIRLNFRDHPTLYLKSGSLLPVQAEFDPGKADDLAKLQVGQFVTVYCRSISEVIAEPLARDCEISNLDASK